MVPVVKMKNSNVKMTLGNREMKSFFKNALPLRKQEICTIKFTPEYAKINYFLPDGKLLILAKYHRNYFKDYESEEEEFVIISKKLFLKKLKYGFRSEYLTFRADPTIGYFSGDKRDDSVIINLIPVAEESKKSLLQTQTIEKELIMPTKNGTVFPLNFLGLFLVNDLVRNLPPIMGKKDVVAVSWDGDDFRAHFLTCDCERKRKVVCESFLVKGEPIIGRFDLRDFLDTLGQFEGQIWLGLGKLGLSVSQSIFGSKRTYILFAQETEEEE